MQAYLAGSGASLNDITRQLIIQLARSTGLVVVEQVITPAELAGADEVFLTGTAYEIQPVRAIEHSVFRVGPITRLLIESFRRTIHAVPQATILPRTGT